VGKNTVVEVEQGRKPHRATLVALCTALGVKPSLLLNPEEGGGQRVTLHKLSTCPDDNVGDGIASVLPGGVLSPTLLKVGSRTKALTGNGESLIYVISGSVHLYLSDSPYLLREGDAASFWSAEPHSFESFPEGGSAARILIVSAAKPSSKRKD
jgi:hypothetical protein